MNYLELLAALYELQAFVSNKRHVHVQLKLDNSTAISYINNKGGIKSNPLNSLARNLWEQRIKRNIYVQAQHAPDTINTTAYATSRGFYPNLEWSLDRTIFDQIVPLTLYLKYRLITFTVRQN